MADEVRPADAERVQRRGDPQRLRLQRVVRLARLRGRARAERLDHDRAQALVAEQLGEVSEAEGAAEQPRHQHHGVPHAGRRHRDRVPGPERDARSRHRTQLRQRALGRSAGRGEQQQREHREGRRGRQVAAGPERQLELHVPPATPLRTVSGRRGSELERRDGRECCTFGLCRDYSSIGKPASRQPRKPPFMEATFWYPMRWRLSAASAER